MHTMYFAYTGLWVLQLAHVAIPFKRHASRVLFPEMPKTTSDNYEAASEFC